LIRNAERAALTVGYPNLDACTESGAGRVISALDCKANALRARGSKTIASMRRVFGI